MEHETAHCNRSGKLQNDERNYEGEKIDNSRYFEGKEIMTAGEKYTSELGQYPVIKLSLKSAKQPNYQMAYGCLRNEIIYEYDRHRYVLKGNLLTEEEKGIPGS